MTASANHRAASLLALDARDPTHYRRALGRFASGVVIVTGMEGETPVGMTCQSFSSVSLEPPLVLFSAAATSTSLPRLRQADSLCINVLAHDQERLAAQFARSGTDKWLGVDWTRGVRGAPRVLGATLWCEGAIVAEHEAGDHSILVVGVSALTTPAQPPPPLIFHDGAFTRLHGVDASTIGR